MTVGNTEGRPKQKEDSVNEIMGRMREITITIRNHNYTATEPQPQSTIDMMKSSVEQPIFKKGEIAMSDQSSPTDKSKAHLVAVYRDTHREESTTNSTMSTKILLKPPIECAPMK